MSKYEPRVLCKYCKDTKKLIGMGMMESECHHCKNIPRLITPAIVDDSIDKTKRKRKRNRIKQIRSNSHPLNSLHRQHLDYKKADKIQSNTIISLQNKMKP